MNRRLRRFLTAIVAAVVICGGLFAALVLSGYSLVVIQNRADTPIHLSVETRVPGQFSWTGELAGRQRVIRSARLTDNSFVAVCRNPGGIHRTSGGYVTRGWPHLIEIDVHSCETMVVEARTLP